MFFRIKPSGERRYLQIVENPRDGARTVQRVLATLGRVEDLGADGKLDALLRSGARFCETAMLISSLQAGTLQTSASVRIGAPMVFGRLWEQTGCRAVIERLAAGRGFCFALERAVFASVLHRLVVSGSDRAGEKWLDAYHIDGADGLELHQLYRAMAWLGEELPAGQQDGATPFAPRCTKDLIEERLFAHRRDLFSRLDLVFMDTTSLSFEGQGGQTLGQHGYSKDHRPDLRQMILAVLIDGDGRPVCSEMWPGNTADVISLVPVIDRLRRRFAIGRVCIVADRGMIGPQRASALGSRSAATIAALEARGLLYILGVRERTDKLVRDVVLNDAAPFVPLTMEKRGRDTDYGAKAVGLGGQRYIVCINHQEAEKDAAERAAILTALERQLHRGDKALVGNAGYRRFLKTVGEGHFAIDRAKAEEDARFAGVFVLRTNTDLNPLAAMLRYKQLWTVEQTFRTAKHLLTTRPIFHKLDETIRGHVFCSFLALVIKAELDARIAALGHHGSWPAIITDLDALTETEVEQHGKRFLLRSAPRPAASLALRAAGVALPPTVQALATS